MKKLMVFLLLLPVVKIYSQNSQTFITKEVAVNSLLNGTLFIPESKSKASSLVILIAGSGPTDRNGNQASMQNNSLKLLAEALAKNGIAVYSYDKRMIAQMKSGNVDEKDMSFDDLIKDAGDVVNYFRAEKKYNKIAIAGHSEGSLVGMVAAQKNADAFISIAGAGRIIDEIIVEQIEKQAPFLKDEIQKDFVLLKSGQTFELTNQMLASIFRESLQPYMISWLKYNPQIEMKKLTIPVLIINGTKDMQVKVGDAELLKQAKPDAKLEIIANMNHVFKETKGDDAENMAMYSNPDLPVMTELVSAVNQFIKSL